jgi:preprotein translocase subunit SecD
MLDYPRWKYILVSIVLLFALLFALPNVFGDDRALQIARKDRENVTVDQLAYIEKVFKDANAAYTSAEIDRTGNALLRFANDTDQLRARDVAKDEKLGLTREYVSAMMYASRAPAWMQAVGLRAMPLGLDLRGGLYLLYEVDVNAAVDQLLQSYDQDIRRALRDASLPFNDVSILTVDSDVPNALSVSLPPGTDRGAVRAAIRNVQTDLQCRDANLANGGIAVECALTLQQVRARQDFAITSNITTLRNRVNAMGVSEPLVQRQGLNRISVQLPGVQNSAEVKDLLGKVATLEYRMVDPRPIPENGRAPIGAKIYTNRDGSKILLKRDVIVTGNQLVNAAPSTGQNGPQVDVTLDSAGGEEMLRNTRANVGKPMAVVFIEQRTEIVNINGVETRRTVKDEKVISVATINGVFGNRFQTTGLTMNEANELSQLLRGGALTAPVSIVNERTVTATLGEQNIKDGVTALIVGMAALFLFMIVYYQLFGVVADLVLLANVIVLTALLSMLGTALTLPGIAGIILTVGMAVDANVLIYERIREELRNGVSPQAAIKAGFEKAFSAIADSNVTTLIAGVVLFVFGTGAIKGFAVVLSLGILTSMFTALMGSRALLTLMFGGKRKIAKLPIG